MGHDPRRAGPAPASGPPMTMPPTAAASLRAAPAVELEELEDFEVQWSADTARSDPDLIHLVCGGRVCTVEHEDTLEVLARAAIGHRCGEGQ